MAYMSGYHTRSGRRRTAPVSVDGRKYKSGGEANIANWLLYNGIPFQYEARYKGNTGSARYRPDFWIVGTNIYIEYFGTDEQGNVPQYFSGTSEDYQRSIEWKRGVHRRNGTVMIELYAYQYVNGQMFDVLERELAGMGVCRNPNPSRRVKRRRRCTLVECRYRFGR